MTPDLSPSEFDPLDEPAEEFLARFRRGERPSLTEYADRYPDLADRIRSLFPALVELERAGSLSGPAVPGIPDHLGSGGPARIGEFRILRKVGEGGMGVVYEAVQESLGRHVALKVLPPTRTGSYLERFRREARAAARLHHTNIVPVFGVGEADGLHFYAMQFISGQGLDSVLDEVRRLRAGKAADPLTNPRGLTRTLLARSVAEGLLTGSFPPAADLAALPPAPEPTAASSQADLVTQPEARYYREVARLGVQAAEALSYAHGQGVLHRDVKPSNLLLDLHGILWVTDFGLAKADDEQELTRTGDLIGTLRYMAPERFRGQADARSEVYALGITLYELLTLRPAFDAADRVHLIEQVCHTVPPRPRKLDRQIPQDLETVVLKATARDPADRYQTAAALADDLRRFLADRSNAARRASVTEQLWRWSRRNKAIARLLTFIVLASVSMAVVFGVQSGPDSPRPRPWPASSASCRTRRPTCATPPSGRWP
jgi:eukaryotic-like serine/threonine-protein kinase